MSDQQVIRLPKQTIAAEGVGEVSRARLKSLSDEELLNCLKQRHHDGWAVLFDRYYRFVLSIARRILQDSGEAEDAAQEIFVEIYRFIKHYDATKGSAKTWIYLLAYRTSLNRRRYLTARKFYQQKEMLSAKGLALHYSPNGRAGLTAEEWEKVLRKGLATLSEKQRRIIEMVHFDGLLLKETALRTNDSLDNVRKCYYRGLSRLKDFLNGNHSSKKGNVR